MCSVPLLMATGKVSPGAVAAGAVGGLGGLALHHVLKKKAPPTAAQTFYGSSAGG